MRTIIFFFITLCLPIAFSMSTHAACNPDDPALAFLQGCANGTNGVPPSAEWEWVEWVRWLVIKIAERALQFAALFAVGAIVWSGIKYTTAYGDDEKVKTAKSTAVYAMIWLVLTLTAFALVDILINFIYNLWT